MSVNEYLSKEDAVGIGRKGTIDRPFYLCGPFWTVDTLFFVKEKREHIGLKFLFLLMQKIRWRKYDESTGVPSLSKQSIERVTVQMPKKEEQEKISNIFQMLDHHITVQQRKSVSKDEVMNLFLCKSNALVDVDVYANSWEQRRLGEIAVKAVDNRGKTPPLSSKGEHPLIEVACLGNYSPDYSKVEKYLEENIFKSALRNYIKKGDILFSTVGNIGLVSLMDDNESAAIAQNIVAFRAKEDFDHRFLYSMFSTKVNRNLAMRITMGAVQPSIKVSQLLDVKYFITDSVDEQQKIGEFFEQLDYHITFQQRR